MYYRTIADLNDIILKRLYILPRNYDLIVGIPRSGMLPANLLALYLNKPYTDLHSFLNGHIYSSGERSQFFDSTEQKKILVVDDSISSGSALQQCKELLASYTDYTIDYCVIYVVPGKEKKVDYWFESVSLPRYFQWNILNHIVLEKSCFDIDGVLCVDPTPEQNDDGSNYKDFLLHAKPLFIPGSKIGTIVTSRLEKYRQETETWLKEHHIRYNKLIMMDLPDMESRKRLGNHATFKAKEFQSLEYTLFIESDLSQALEINRLTKKPVLCTQNFNMIFEAESVLFNIKSGKYFPFVRQLALKLRNILRNRKQAKK